MCSFCLWIIIFRIGHQQPDTFTVESSPSLEEVIEQTTPLLPGSSGKSASSSLLQDNCVWLWVLWWLYSSTFCLVAKSKGTKGYKDLLMTSRSVHWAVSHLDVERRLASGMNKRKICFYKGLIFYAKPVHSFVHITVPSHLFKYSCSFLLLHFMQLSIEHCSSIWRWALSLSLFQ